MFITHLSNNKAITHGFLVVGVSFGTTWPAEFQDKSLSLSTSCLNVTEGPQHRMSCETRGGRDYAAGLEEVLLCQLVFRNSFLDSVFQAFSTLKNTFKPSKTFGS